MSSLRRGIIGAIALAAVLGAATAAMAGLTTRSDTESVETNTVGIASAQCPPSREVVAQGFKSAQFDSTWTNEAIYPIASRRGGSRRAKASGLNLGGSPGDLTAYAYCAKPKPDLSIVRSDPVPVAAQTVEVARARCPRGSEAVGGGSRSVGFSTGLFGTAPRVYTIGSRRAGTRTWKVTGAEINNGDGGSIVALAYCDQSPPGLAKRVTRVAVPGVYGSQGTATARCASDEAARSGGFQVVGFDPTYGSGPTPYPLASKRAGRRGWTARAHQDNTTGAEGQLKAVAYCKS